MYVGKAIKPVVEITVPEDRRNILRAVQVAVSRGQAILVVEVVIDFDIKLAAVRAVQHHLVKILNPWGCVVECGAWIQIDDFLPDGIDQIGIDHIRDHEVGAGPASINIKRIVNMLLYWLAHGTTLRGVSAQNKCVPEI